MKDKKLEYGLVDKNKNIKSSCCLELLFHAKHWYYERFDFGWDELESMCEELHDFFDSNFLYGVTGVILYKKNNPRDSLRHEFTMDDIRKKYELQMHSENKLALVELLKPRLRYIYMDLDTVNYTNPQNNDYFLLTWKGDTATLENYRIDGEYYIVLKRD